MLGRDSEDSADPGDPGASEDPADPTDPGPWGARPHARPTMAMPRSVSAKYFRVRRTACAPTAVTSNRRCSESTRHRVAYRADGQKESAESVRYGNQRIVALLYGEVNDRGAGQVAAQGSPVGARID